MKKFIVLVFLTIISICAFAQEESYPYHLSIGGGGMIHKDSFFGGLFDLSFNRSIVSYLRVGADISLADKFKKDDTQKESLFQKYAIFAAIAADKKEYGYMISLGPSYLNAQNISCVGIDFGLKMWISCLSEHFCVGLQAAGDWNKQYSFAQNGVFLMYRF